MDMRTDMRMDMCTDMFSRMLVPQRGSCSAAAAAVSGLMALTCIALHLGRLQLRRWQAHFYAHVYIRTCTRICAQVYPRVYTHFYAQPTGAGV